MTAKKLMVKLAADLAVMPNDPRACLLITAGIATLTPMANAWGRCLTNHSHTISLWYSIGAWVMALAVLVACRAATLLWSASVAEEDSKDPDKKSIHTAVAAGLHTRLSAVFYTGITTGVCIACFAANSIAAVTSSTKLAGDLILFAGALALLASVCALCATGVFRSPH